jgi:hypothetical protein
LISALQLGTAIGFMARPAMPTLIASTLDIARKPSGLARDK